MRLVLKRKGSRSFVTCATTSAAGQRLRAGSLETLGAAGNVLPCMVRIWQKRGLCTRRRAVRSSRAIHLGGQHDRPKRNQARQFRATDPIRRHCRVPNTSRGQGARVGGVGSYASDRLWACGRRLVEGRATHSGERDGAWRCGDGVRFRVVANRSRASFYHTLVQDGPSRNGVSLRTRAEVCPYRRTL